MKAEPRGGPRSVAEILNRMDSALSDEILSNPYALRDFLVRAHASWQTPPRFVTLVGNATTDPRNYLGLDEPDYVPTKVVSTASLETAAVRASSSPAPMVATTTAVDASAPAPPLHNSVES